MTTLLAAGRRRDSRQADDEPARSARWLLPLLVVVWGVSWPVIKVGVSAMPPLWFACDRYVVATICLFTVVGFRGELVLPSRSDWRFVIVSGALQMSAYSALTTAALTILPPGRASVLAFSTPLWVVPLSAWWLREHTSRRQLAGVAFGLCGVAVIASPDIGHGAVHQILAYAMLLGAAGAWAVSITFVRLHRFRATALALAPWQMLVAVALLLPLAAIFEGAPSAIAPRALASLAYVAPVATAFAYWAVVEVGRQVPASTMSVALLATPTLGLLVSSLLLAEPVSASLLIGIAFVAAGIRLATSVADVRRPAR